MAELEGQSCRVGIYMRAIWQSTALDAHYIYSNHFHQQKSAYCVAGVKWALSAKHKLSNCVSVTFGYRSAKKSLVQ